MSGLSYLKAYFSSMWNALVDDYGSAIRGPFSNRIFWLWDFQSIWFDKIKINSIVNK